MYMAMTALAKNQGNHQETEYWDRRRRWSYSAMPCQPQTGKNLLQSSSKTAGLPSNTSNKSAKALNGVKIMIETIGGSISRGSTICLSAGSRDFGDMVNRFAKEDTYRDILSVCKKTESSSKIEPVSYAKNYKVQGNGYFAKNDKVLGNGYFASKYTGSPVAHGSCNDLTQSLKNLESYKSFTVEKSGTFYGENHRQEKLDNSFYLGIQDLNAAISSRVTSASDSFEGRSADQNSDNLTRLSPSQNHEIHFGGRIDGKPPAAGSRRSIGSGKPNTSATSNSRNYSRTYSKENSSGALAVPIVNGLFIEDVKGMDSKLSVRYQNNLSKNYDAVSGTSENSSVNHGLADDRSAFSGTVSPGVLKQEVNQNPEFEISGNKSSFLMLGNFLTADRQNIEKRADGTVSHGLGGSSSTGQNGRRPSVDRRNHEDEGLYFACRDADELKEISSKWCETSSPSHSKIDGITRNITEIDKKPSEMKETHCVCDDKRALDLTKQQMKLCKEKLSNTETDRYLCLEQIGIGVSNCGKKFTDNSLANSKSGSENNYLTGTPVALTSQKRLRNADELVASSHFTNKFSSNVQPKTASVCCRNKSENLSTKGNLNSSENFAKSSDLHAEKPFETGGRTCLELFGICGPGVLGKPLLSGQMTEVMNIKDGQPFPVNTGKLQIGCFAPLPAQSKPTSTTDNNIESTIVQQVHVTGDQSSSDLDTKFQDVSQPVTLRSPQLSGSSNNSKTILQTQSLNQSPSKNVTLENCTPAVGIVPGVHTMSNQESAKLPRRNESERSLFDASTVASAMSSVSTEVTAVPTSDKSNVREEEINRCLKKAEADIQMLNEIIREACQRLEAKCLLKHKLLEEKNKIHLRKTQDLKDGLVKGFVLKDVAGWKPFHFGSKLKPENSNRVVMPSNACSLAFEISSKTSHVQVSEESNNYNCRKATLETDAIRANCSTVVSGPAVTAHDGNQTVFAKNPGIALSGESSRYFKQLFTSNGDLTFSSGINSQSSSAPCKNLSSNVSEFLLHDVSEKLLHDKRQRSSSRNSCDSVFCDDRNSTSVEVTLSNPNTQQMLMLQGPSSSLRKGCDESVLPERCKSVGHADAEPISAITNLNKSDKMVLNPGKPLHENSSKPIKGLSTLPQCRQNDPVKSTADLLLTEKENSVHDETGTTAPFQPRLGVGLRHGGTGSISPKPKWKTKKFRDQLRCRSSSTADSMLSSDSSGIELCKSRTVTRPSSPALSFKQKRKRQSPMEQLLKEYLHQSSSSDIDIEGLESPQPVKLKSLVV